MEKAGIRGKDQKSVKRKTESEIWCETCWLEEQEKLGEQDGIEKRVKLYKYVGETSRSCFVDWSIRLE